MSTSQRKPRILVVDDTPDVGQGLRDALVLAGYDTDFEPSSSASVELFRQDQNHYEFVLMDQVFQAPELDGLEAIREIRKISQDVRIMMLTEYGSFEASRAALNAGAYRYIFRPCSDETIISAIQTAEAVTTLERELNQKDSILSRILDHVGIGISIIDRTFHILYMNAYQRQISGEGAMTGGVCWVEYNRDFKSNKPCPWCPTEPAMNSGASAVRMTSSVVDGQLRYFSVMASPVKDANGTVLGVIEFVRDVTDQHLAEAEALRAGGTEEMLRATLQRICTLEFSRARLYELSGDREWLRGRVAFGGTPVSIADTWIRLADDPYSQRTLRSGQPQIYRKVDLGQMGLDSQFLRDDVDEWVDIPMWWKGELVGKITADAKNLRPVPPGQLPLSTKINESKFDSLMLLAGSAAREIIKDRVMRRIESESKILRGLRSLAELVARPNTRLQENLDETIRLCKDLIGADGVYLRLLEEDALVLRAGCGAYYKHVLEMRPIVPLNDPESASARVYQTHKPFVESDARSELDPQCSNPTKPESAEGARVCSFANIPVTFEREFLGVICLQSKEVAFFQPEVLNAANDFAAAMGPILRIMRFPEELQRAQEQLRVAARTAAHRINNPSFAIQTRAQRWLKMVDTSEPSREDTANTMRRIAASADRVANIVKDLQRFLKVPQPRQPKNPIHLGAFIRQEVEAVVTAQIGVSVNAPPGVPPVWLDGQILSDIFSELAANSRKAMEGKGVISIEIRPAQDQEIVEAALISTRRYVRIALHNTGPSIPADKKNWIFQPFNTLSPEGTGLGLAVVRNSVGALGGAIREVGSEGNGALFVLYLPVSQEDNYEQAATD